MGIKILCVGSHRKPSNALRRAETFERLGHKVERLDTSRFGYFRHEAIRKIALGPGYPLVRLLLDRALARKMAMLKPDVVFFEKSTWLKASTLQRIKRLGGPNVGLVHYNPDDPFGVHDTKLWDNFIPAISAYDIHFVPKPSNVEEYKRHGANLVYVFDRSYDPTLHQPVEMSAEDENRFGCDVGFIGTWAPHREAVISRMVQNGLPISVWGDGWQRGPHWGTIKSVWRGPTQINANYVKAICGMKIALHFLRRENRDEQDSRTFEIPACGTFMLAERSPTHERLFEDGKEAVFFDDSEDLERKVRHFLENPEERERIANAGLERARNSGYDHASRLSEILGIVLGDTPK